MVQAKKLRLIPVINHAEKLPQITLPWVDEIRTRLNAYFFNPLTGAPFNNYSNYDLGYLQALNDMLDYGKLRERESQKSWDKIHKKEKQNSILQDLQGGNIRQQPVGEEANKNGILRGITRHDKRLLRQRPNKTRRKKNQGDNKIV
jgi:hypothetical protein